MDCLTGSDVISLDAAAAHVRCKASNTNCTLSQTDANCLYFLQAHAVKYKTICRRLKWDAYEGVRFLPSLHPVSQNE
jgi:hypothetical protein